MEVRLLQGNLPHGFPDSIVWSNVVKVPYFWSVFTSLLRLRCCSFHLPPDILFISLHLLNDCTVNRYHSWKILTTQKSGKKGFMRRVLALCRVFELHKVCVLFPVCIFTLIRQWRLTIFDWYVFVFFSLFLHKTYFCIFTLRNLLLSVMQFCYSWVYIYTDIHIFLYLPPFSFNFLCAYVQKSTSTQYYRLYNVDSYLFFTFMYELRFCKNAFTVLVCKIYV